MVKFSYKSVELEVYLADVKNARINVRISSDKKEAFYDLCEKHGLCPSLLIDKWIERFIKNSKKNKIDFKEIYSASLEKNMEKSKYKRA